jgi:hypothetical protein
LKKRKRQWKEEKKKGYEEPGSPRADGERERDLLGMINRRRRVRESNSE